MSSIEARDITVVRGGRTLLDGINLAVPDAETLVLVGPPGAGKSLLMQVLVGLQDPTSGDVVIDDRVVTNDAPRKRDLSMVFEDYALHPSRDVYDNLEFAATLRRGVDREALATRVEDVADLLGLVHDLELRTADLDEQTRQRVAIGRAIVRDASAYLLDQPFAAQSARVRPHVRSVVLQWQREHARTTILTTSDVDEALASADRVAVIHQGFIHQVGTPRELYEKPADMFVAGYLGAPPMNLIPGFPSGGGVETALGRMELSPAQRAAVGEREVVVIGVRPEHLGTAGSGFSFTGTVDDLEWRGRSQFVYVGYDIDPALEAVLTEVEELVDFDLFQSFVMAELPSDRTLEHGSTIRLGAEPQHVHLFDPVTGENLSA
ncbi:MAG TPA: ABC transporter ATP-binding protein [Aeromicrobium sp.]|nr:ABC transporter ATP-binding protein [Aeromicrobium sp.]